MKLNRWICTSSVLQAINRCWKSQGGPPSLAGGQVLVCFCSPPPHVLVQVPSGAHSPHKHSVGHCNRYRIIQLYSCYRSDNDNERTWYSESKQSCLWSNSLFGVLPAFSEDRGVRFLDYMYVDWGMKDFNMRKRIHNPGSSLHHPPPKGSTLTARLRVAILVPGTSECFCK